MSQKIVYQLLKELGGRATRGQIARLAKERYPDATLYSYVGHQLRKLKKWDYVDYNPATNEWFIKSEYRGG